MSLMNFKLILLWFLTLKFADQISCSFEELQINPEQHSCRRLFESIQSTFQSPFFQRITLYITAKKICFEERLIQDEHCFGKLKIVTPRFLKVLAMQLQPLESICDNLNFEKPKSYLQSDCLNFNSKLGPQKHGSLSKFPNSILSNKNENPKNNQLLSSNNTNKQNSSSSSISKDQRNNQILQSSNNNIDTNKQKNNQNTNLQQQNSQQLKGGLSVQDLACSFCQYLDIGIRKGQSCEDLCVQFPMTQQCQQFCQQDLQLFSKLSQSPEQTCINLSVCPVSTAEQK